MRRFLGLMVGGWLCLGTTLWAAPITGNTGPGGFEATDAASSLLYWLRADAGIVTDGGGNVQQWNDQRTFSPRNFYQGSAGLRPATGTAINGLPTVSFDGVDDRLTHAAATTVRSIVAVNRLGTETKNYGGLIGPTNAGGTGVRRHIVGTNQWRNLDTNDFPFTAGGAVFVNGTATNSVAGNVNHILTMSRPSALNWGSTSIGDWEPLASGRQYIGNVAEVLAYSTELNSVQRTMVENYMSSKYGIAISNDRYSGDTLHGYTRGVFGVGNDGTNSLLNAGHEGFGMETTLASLGSGEFVLAGHDAASNSWVDLGGQTHWERVWFVDTNGNTIEDITLGFNFADAGIAPLSGVGQYELYYSSTDPFSFTALGSAALTGNDLLFNLANLQSGFYTVGFTVPLAPEPTSLALLGVAFAGFGLWHWRRRTAA